VHYKVHYIGVFPEKQKPPNAISPNRLAILVLVEATGIEPVSENISCQISPGAVCLLKFPPPDGDKQPSDFSSFMIHIREQSLSRRVHH